MLPPPATTRHHRHIRFNSTSRRNEILDMLRRQSRVTNLAVFILIGISSISILFNLRYWMYNPNYLLNFDQHETLTAQRPLDRKFLTHLIVVPCHSIWVGSVSWSEDKDWLLESYQRGSSRVKAFYEHIARGCAFINCGEKRFPHDEKELNLRKTTNGLS